MGTIARGTKAGGGTNLNTGQANNAAELNTDFNTIVTEINGALDDANVETATIPGAKSLRFTEVSTPSNPSSNDLLVYAKDQGTRTRLVSHDSAGFDTILGSVELDSESSTEVTTTSPTSVDLATLTLTNSLPTGDGLLIVGGARKTTGAATTVSIGLKLNTTQVIANSAIGSGANAAESNLFVFFVGPRSTNHLRQVGGLYWAGGMINGTADLPNAAITGITITGQSGNAAVTLGVADVAVYRMSRA